MYIAPDITAPTLETVREVVGVTFKKVESFLKRINQKNVTIKVSVQRVGRLFEIQVEILDFPKTNPFVKVQEHDLRAGISKAAKKIRKVIVDKKEKL